MSVRGGRREEGEALFGWIPAAHRRWIAVNALVVAALANAIINWLVAWLTVRDIDRVPLWSVGQVSALTDTLGTLFFLPFLTCVLLTGAVRRELRTGRLVRIPDLARRQPLLAALPTSRIRRGLAFGAVTLVALAVPMTALIVATDLGDVSGGQFIAFKVLFAVTLGAVVTPAIAVCAMADRLCEPSSPHEHC